MLTHLRAVERETGLPTSCWRIALAAENPGVLRTIETREAFNTFPSVHSFVGVDYIVSKFGEHSITEFFENLSTVGQLNHNEAFAMTWGISLETFYQDYEEYLAQFV